MKNPSEKFVITAFIIALSILLTISYLTYKSIDVHFEDENLINQTFQHIQTAEALIRSLSEASANRRGYLITSNMEFLEEYHEAVTRTDSIYRKLKELTENNLTQQMLLDTIGEQLMNRKDLFQESLELQSNRAMDYKGQIVLTEKGRIAHERIAELILRVEYQDNSEQRKRYMALDRSASITIISLVSGVTLSFILLIFAFVLLLKDIKQRRQYERALEDSRNWFSTTLASIGDGVIVTNEIGDVTFMNKIAEELTGWKFEEAGGNYLDNIFNIIHERTRKKIESPIQRVFKSGKTTVIANNSLLISKSGKEIPIDDSIAPILSNNLTLLGAVLVFRDISKRRKTEIELEKNRKFSEKIADSTPNILYLYDLKGPKIIYVNRNIQDSLGYHPKFAIELGENFFRNFMNEDDYKTLKDGYKKYLQANDNEVIENTYRIKNRKGEWRWMQSFDVVFSRNDDGIPSQILGSAIDITERKNLENELKKYSSHLEELVENRTYQLKISNVKLQNEILERNKAEKNIIEAEEKFRKLVENSLVGIYIIQEGKFSYANPKMEEILGYQCGELLGKDISMTILDEDKEFVYDNIRKRLNKVIQTIQYSFRAVKKNGDVIKVEVRGSTLEINSINSVIGTIHDITEREKAEEEIRNQREFLRKVIDTDPSFIFAKDWDGRFTLVNKAVADTYGTTVNELIGRTDADFNPIQEEVEKFIRDDREVMSSLVPKLIPEEAVYNAKKQHDYWYQTIKVPFVTPEGQKQVLGVSTDITSRKIAEEAIRKSLKEKELLLKEIHHRVKNNLQIIVSLLKLQSKYIHDVRDLDIFNKSRARVETMSLIHEKLYKSADIEDIKIGSYLKDLTTYLLNAYGVNQSLVEVRVKAEDVRLGIDTAIPCGLIINELFSNSLKHAFHPEQNGMIEIEIFKNEDKITMTVSDNGKGIPPNYDVQNTDSLGLQLVYTLVKQLDGTMTINNACGAKFYFVLRELKYRERI